MPEAASIRLILPALSNGCSSGSPSSGAFSGGGFGGFCVALMDPLKSGEAIERLHAKYAELQPEFGERFQAIPCRGADGIELLC